MKEDDFHLKLLAPNFYSGVDEIQANIKRLRELTT